MGDEDQAEPFSYPIRHKVQALIQLVSDLSGWRERLNEERWPAIYAARFDLYLLESFREDKSHKQSFLNWYYGNVRQPQARSRSHLAAFFDNEMHKFFGYDTAVRIDPDWFRDDVTIAQFLENISQFRTRSREVNTRIFLPHSTSDELWAFRKSEIEKNLLGCKVIFRRAIEDTGRISREVVKIYSENGHVKFNYWFCEKGSGSRASRI